MTWIPLLLADRSACLRWLVLRNLLNRPDDDPEMLELVPFRENDHMVSPVLAAQEPDGAWSRGDLQWQGGKRRVTMLALMRLGFLAFDLQHPAVRAGAEYLFSLQQNDGSWDIPGQSQETDTREGYSMIPLQTALPLRALAMCGYAEDPRAERAFEWLLDKRLPDGAWPTGVAGGDYGYVAGYRKMPHSRWGCRSNTTGALQCLAYHPTRCQGPETQKALDMLLGRETRESHTLGYEVVRLTGAEPTRGFFTFYARFYLGQILDLCWRIGATLEDARVDEIVTFVNSLQGEYGLWNVNGHPEVSRWVTYDLLHSLMHLDTSGDWMSAEPRTPFQTYPKKARRY